MLKRGLLDVEVRRKIRNRCQRGGQGPRYITQALGLVERLPGRSQPLLDVRTHRGREELQLPLLDLRDQPGPEDRPATHIELELVEDVVGVARAAPVLAYGGHAEPASDVAVVKPAQVVDVRGKEVRARFEDQDALRRARAPKRVRELVRQQAPAHAGPHDHDIERRPRVVRLCKESALGLGSLRD